MSNLLTIHLETSVSWQLPKSERQI